MLRLTVALTALAIALPVQAQLTGDLNYDGPGAYERGSLREYSTGESWDRVPDDVYGNSYGGGTYRNDRGEFMECDRDGRCTKW